MVSVGFDEASEVGGVMEARNKGHSIMDLARVFKRNGR